MYKLSHSDVSEIYYNSEEIKRNNEKLAKLNQKLEEMYERIGDEIREQETLSMKMQVHDNFGRSLLSIRRILEDKESPENMKEQLETLKQPGFISLPIQPSLIKKTNMRIPKDMQKNLVFPFRSRAAIQILPHTGALQIALFVNA